MITKLQLTLSRLNYLVTPTGVPNELNWPISTDGVVFGQDECFNSVPTGSLLLDFALGDRDIVLKTLTSHNSSVWVSL